jgi:rubredoxin
MNRYVCGVCGFVYDEDVGLPDDNIDAGTRWEDLPDNWSCPLCGATKAEFEVEATSAIATTATGLADPEADLRGLSFGELSALCSNLSKGCEKQYRPEEAGLFDQLSQYFFSKSQPLDGQTQMANLMESVDADIESKYPVANEIASSSSDRGALRALVWGEKVTRIQKSILKRYEKQQDALLEDTNVYVCEICGFVYIGDSAPAVCPVCKVPNDKLIAVKRS